jgi:sulfate adenylyltransferase subunit 1
VNTLEKVQVDSLELNAIAMSRLSLMRLSYLIATKTAVIQVRLSFIDRLNNVTIGAGMVEESVEWSAHSNPVTAEDRAARLGQNLLR